MSEGATVGDGIIVRNGSSVNGITRPAVSVRDLFVVLGGQPVLRGVNLDVASGEWVNIIGPNGAGKTTLLRAVLGLIPYQGQITVTLAEPKHNATYGTNVAETAGRANRTNVADAANRASRNNVGNAAGRSDGNNVGNAAGRARRRNVAKSAAKVSQSARVKRATRALAMAYVAQSPVIPPGVLVADYVLLGRTPHQSMFSAFGQEDRRIVAETLERLDLAGFDQRDLTSLSGGERQRAVLARALVQQTPIVLFDEPTTALDLGHQQDVLDLIENLRSVSDLTVIATLHDLTLAARYGNRVAVLCEGRIVAEGSPSDVLTDQLIADVFKARVRVINDTEGPVIAPI